MRLQTVIIVCNCLNVLVLFMNKTIIYQLVITMRG